MVWPSCRSNGDRPGRTETTVKIAVDQHRCASSGNCALSVPTVFDQRPDDGVVVLLDESPPDSMAEEILEAQDMCPAQAISVQP